MPANFVRRTFDQWLAQNIGRFQHAPIIAKQCKDHFILHFNGVTPCVQCFIGRKWQVEIHAIHDREVWDILADFDLVERRSEVGTYRCALCVEPIEYPSRASLWISEAFEPLMSWVEETLAAADKLSIYERPGGGGRFAELSSTGEVGSDSDAWLVATHPVLVPPSSRNAMAGTTVMHVGSVAVGEVPRDA